MKEKKNLVQKTLKQAVQRMLQRESAEWPPGCWGVKFQLFRPETPLAEFPDGNSGKKA